MYKLTVSLFVAAALSSAPLTPFSSSHKAFDPALQLLKKEVLKDILAEKVNEPRTIELAEKMKEDGSWADIDYTDKTRGSWPVNEHLVRLDNMAVIYARKGSRWLNDQKLKSKILLGLDYWFRNDFICPNWWYPQIGVPKVLGPTMLIMEESLSPEQKEAGLKILGRAKIGMTGQNKVWLSGNVIYRSLLTNEADQINAAVQAIQSEVVVSEGEGIQADNSFHQHGPQQQFGNYGSSFAADMLKWGNIFQPTSFRFETKKIEIIRNYLLGGMSWIIWKNKMDISACGRQLFPEAQTGKANGIKTIFSKMPLIDPQMKSAYAKALENFEGEKHFWRSDMTVHRRKTFYASVKMSSKRVGGAESCNDENIAGYHLGDGATYFYQSGNEYTDIFPFWDWKKIPGTTTFHDGAPLPVLPCDGYRLATDFVGGVTDGMNGMATLAYTRDSLSAQKSWFFFNDAIICLGAGINSMENKEVNTTINQSFLNGNVIVKASGAQKTLPMGEQHLNNVNWVLHDNWGYYFPGGSGVELSNREQSGDWHRVVKRMPSNEIRARLFTLWFNHNNKPQDAAYAYYVFPAATTSNIEQRAAGITVIENSAKLQAVEAQGKQMAGFVFVAPGEAKGSICRSISVDKPCMVFFTKKNGLLNMMVSEPTHLLDKIVVAVAGNKKAANASAVFDAAENVTRFTISLPKGAEAGKTISLTLK